MQESRTRPVTVTIGGPVRVGWMSYDGREDREITDEEVIRSFDGRTYLDDHGELPVQLSVYLQDGADTLPLWALGVRGGTLRYEYRGADGLWIVSQFESPRALDEAELGVLCDFMRGQWSDGAGPNFAGELADENDGTGPFGDPTSVHVSQWPR